VPAAGANLEFFLAKPVDIPTFVEYGIADIGIVGKEILLEENRDVYELLDLGISAGFLSVIGKSNTINSNPRVATSYPKIALRYFKEKGMQAEIIKLSGSTELALFTGLADHIIEVYNKQNFKYLFEIEKICSISFRLIANRASFQVKNDSIRYIVEELI
jgi:ATP phosphoribosyltransferase